MCLRQFASGTLDGYQQTKANGEMIGGEEERVVTVKAEKGYQKVREFKDSESFKLLT